MREFGFCVGCVEPDLHKQKPIDERSWQMFLVFPLAFPRYRGRAQAAPAQLWNDYDLKHGMRTACHATTRENGGGWSILVGVRSRLGRDAENSTAARQLGNGDSDIVNCE